MRHPPVLSQGYPYDVVTTGCNVATADVHSRREAFPGWAMAHGRLQPAAVPV